MDQPLETLDITFDRLQAEILSRKTFPELPTGLAPLDEKIWGLHKQELCLIGGRPGEGKTTLALHMAYTLVDAGKRVMFLSLEMTREQLLERLFCLACQIDGWALRTGQPPADYGVRVAAFKELTKRFQLHIIPLGYTFGEITMLFEQVFKNGGPPDVLFLDYIQLISVGKASTSREAIDEYLKALKELSMRYNVAIVALSQMNRAQMSNKSGRPSLHHFKQSGAFEEIGDCCLLCWWRTMDQETIDPSKSEYRIIIAKQRYGPLGEVAVNFHPNRFCFSLLPQTSWTAQNTNNGASL